MKRTHFINELSDLVGKEIILNGWVHDVRVLGGISFVVLRDNTGKVQITASRKTASEEILNTCAQLRQEDVISVRGTLVKSSIATIGIELIPTHIEIVNKAQTPLPLDPRNVTPAGLNTQIDWRVVYFRSDEAQAIFRIQSHLLNAFREFCITNGYLEIQPPILISSASEGGAELFSVPYFEKQAFLAQSPQLYKQIGATSFEKVFSVVPIFRAEKFEQPTHLNEIRQMDLEQAFIDNVEAVEILEKTFLHLVKSVSQNCVRELSALGRKLQIPSSPFMRITYEETIQILQRAGEKIEWGDDYSKTQEKMLQKLIGSNVFFIVDWPSEVKAFYAMPYEDKPEVCRAYDLVYEGLEIASGTQRVHLPDLLIKQIRSKGLDPDKFAFYINAFRYGTPPHSGWSIGLERLTMTVLGRTNIREVTMFPRDRNRLSP